MKKSLVPGSSLYAVAQAKAKEKGALNEKAGSLQSWFWTLVGLALLLLMLGVI